MCVVDPPSLIYRLNSLVNGGIECVGFVLGGFSPLLFVLSLVLWVCVLFKRGVTSRISCLSVIFWCGFLVWEEANRDPIL